MKRKRTSHAAQNNHKRIRFDTPTDAHPTTSLLRLYYPHVLTLRQYLVTKLPKSSKKRRRKLAQYGLRRDGGVGDPNTARLLDSTIVGTFDDVDVQPVDLQTIDREIIIFTQQLSESTILTHDTQDSLKQSEIVDFVVWQLFRKHFGTHRPPHILCHGQQRTAGPINDDAGLRPVPGVPGVFASCRNPHVQTLKEAPWTDLPSLLGSRAERIISELLMSCGVFVPIGGSSNLSQLSGKPLPDLKCLRLLRENDGSRRVDGPTASVPVVKRGLSDIRFVRHRILYARPCMSAKGKICFGLGHTHALNRGTDSTDLAGTIHLMKYIFPKQFRLHNVFTSDTDPKDTAQPFKDYALREKEIAQANYDWKQKRKQPISREDVPNDGPPVPKRLRGPMVSLLHRLRKRHARCSYYALLQHYCAVRQNPKGMTDDSTRFASSPTQVSAFCRSALSNVFPNDFWGSERAGTHNQGVISRCVDNFIHIRRYETMSMHEVMQGIKLSDVPWLAPPGVDSAQNLSSTDFAKRKEVMAELLYYVFDSFLISLLRSCFYITESHVHRNQLFYFRHDVWQTMTAPSLNLLKATMMEECSAASVRKMLAKRALGVSHVRLLPKERGMRPIINLRRRVQRLQHGEVVLGRSINSLLTPAFSVLNYEKAAHGELLASALFSVDDIFPRLQAFRDSLDQHGHGRSPLFFGKIDVQACFDTIPQQRLMSLVKVILGTERYNVMRYARGKLLGRHNDGNDAFGAKPSWRFLTKASRQADPARYMQEAEADGAAGRSRSIFVDGVVQRVAERRAVLNLLEEHIEANLIKIGKRFYRQKKGIPQGSIVSSLLCSYIYGELERTILGFLDDGKTLLLRLIDDFLVISPRREVVERFMRTMHKGVPEFGVTVKAEKSRVNFDLTIDETPIARVPEVSDFPYCGNAINTRTLDLSKDMDRRRGRSNNAVDSVTVEYSRLPGQTFYRKSLNALKLQMHTMLLSTSYNGFETVLSNLYHCFMEVALKSYHYVRSLPANKQPGHRLLIRTVDDTIKLACVMMKRRKRTSREEFPYECAVKSTQARWLACTAFHVVFQRRQTKYATLLGWLETQLESRALRAQKRLLAPVATRYG